jgi:hypothetical protein
MSSAKASRNKGPGKPLAQSLARETEIDPDLALVVERWDALPEPIRRAVLALIGSASG